MKDAAARRLFPAGLDLGWRNWVFSLRTALAAVCALGLAYGLNIDDPQWATLTVYLLAQPTVGAAFAKGMWRAAGTIAGGLTGLAVVALFSQAAELLVGATVTLIGLSFYAGARMRNFASYGVLLGGYTMLLVAYEGGLAPDAAWQIAANRMAAILIGIACITTASSVIMPRYAGAALRSSLSRVFAGLARYSALALRPDTPLAAFAAARSAMVAEVVQFDALRSYTVFEAPEMHADDGALRRTVREFLIALSVGRGLYFRLEDFRRQGAEAVLARMKPAMEEAAAALGRLAAVPDALAAPHGVRRALRACRVRLGAAARDIEGMAGQVAFDPLANGLLVTTRAADLLHALAMVAVVEAASTRPASRAHVGTQRAKPAAASHREAALIGLRAALAILLLSVFWLATTWQMGFSVVAGGSVMLFFAVNQDDPLPAGRTFALWTGAGVAAAYALFVFVIPRLDAFEALAGVLVLALLPAGLMAGSPPWAAAGAAFGSFFMSEISPGNLAAPNETAIVDGGLALVLGMVICMAALAIMPLTSRSARSRVRVRTLAEILPAVARGSLAPGQASGEILTALAALLPRLAAGRDADDAFLRGTLGAASCTVELGRLTRLLRTGSLPPPARSALAEGLEGFAAAMNNIGAAATDPAALAAAQSAIDATRAALAALPPAGDSAGQAAVLRAGAALRFISGRFVLDGPFLLPGSAQKTP